MSCRSRAGSPGKFALGMMVTGPFTNTFAEKEVPAWPAKEGEEEPAGEPEEEELTPAPGTLIVMGCAKVFSDALMGNPPNLNLFANMVDGLALGDDLIQIRAKRQSGRQIKRLTDAQKVGWRFAVLVLVPLCWIGLAFARFFLRRKEKQFYLLARDR